MTTIIDTIERFEAALKAAAFPLFFKLTAPDVPDLADAEAALHEALCQASNHEDHEAVCEPCARGCMEGVAYRGTVYAPGFGPEGEPCVIVMRRVRDARDIGPCLTRLVL